MPTREQLEPSDSSEPDPHRAAPEAGTALPSADNRARCSWILAVSLVGTMVPLVASCSPPAATGSSSSRSAADKGDAGGRTVYAYLRAYDPRHDEDALADCSHPHEWQMSAEDDGFLSGVGPDGWCTLLLEPGSAQAEFSALTDRGVMEDDADPYWATLGLALTTREATTASVRLAKLAIDGTELVILTSEAEIVPALFLAQLGVVADDAVRAHAAIWEWLDTDETQRAYMATREQIEKGKAIRSAEIKRLLRYLLRFGRSAADAVDEFTRPDDQPECPRRLAYWSGEWRPGWSDGGVGMFRGPFFSAEELEEVYELDQPLADGALECIPIDFRACAEEGGSGLIVAPAEIPLEFADGDLADELFCVFFVNHSRRQFLSFEPVLSQYLGLPAAKSASHDIGRIAEITTIFNPSPISVEGSGDDLFGNAVFAGVIYGDDLEQGADPQQPYVYDAQSNIVPHSGSYKGVLVSSTEGQPAVLLRVLPSWVVEGRRR